jgi:hypothetical protein
MNADEAQMNAERQKRMDRARNAQGRVHCETLLGFLCVHPRFICVHLRFQAFGPHHSAT